MIFSKVFWYFPFEQQMMPSWLQNSAFRNVFTNSHPCSFLSLGSQICCLPFVEDIYSHFCIQPFTEKGISQIKWTSRKLAFPLKNWISPSLWELSLPHGGGIWGSLVTCRALNCTSLLLFNYWRYILICWEMFGRMDRKRNNLFLSV